MFIRKEFNQYDDGTIYFLYVTDTLRIETDGKDSLQVENRQGEVLPVEHYLVMPEVQEAMLELSELISTKKLVTKTR